MGGPHCGGPLIHPPADGGLGRFPLQGGRRVIYLEQMSALEVGGSQPESISMERQMDRGVRLLAVDALL